MMNMNSKTANNRNGGRRGNGGRDRAGSRRLLGALGIGELGLGLLSLWGAALGLGLRRGGRCCGHGGNSVHDNRSWLRRGLDNSGGWGSDLGNDSAWIEPICIAVGKMPYA
jgi:hypothetical protein